MTEKQSNWKIINIVDIPRNQDNRESKLTKQENYLGEFRYVKITRVTQNYQERCSDFFSGKSTQTDQPVFAAKDFKTEHLIQSEMFLLFGLVYFKYLEKYWERKQTKPD